MNDTAALAQAVANNIVWCDAVCRAAGGHCSLGPTLWLNTAVSPRAHPNAITRLGGPAACADQVAQLAALSAQLGAGRGWGVKDSFAQLDLGPLGFERLFDAEWLHRPARAAQGRSTLTWRGADHADALAAWESAGSGDAAETAKRVFADTLLGRPDIAFLSGLDHGHPCCGFVATRSDRVVGLSNLFASSAAPPDWREQACAAAQTWAPGLDLVGYEHGTELPHFHRLGFRSIGPLRVWRRNAGVAGTAS